MFDSKNLFIMKNLLVIVLAVVGSLVAYAAEREYLPLVEE